MRPDEVKTTLIKVTHHHPAHVAAHWPYAAYGSNLCMEQMSQRCRSANVLTSGKLPGYKLAFEKFCTIVPDSEGNCPVGIYTLNANDVAVLDKQEGLGRSYDRYLVTALTADGRALRCFTYIQKVHRPYAPTERYYAIVAKGYRDWHFDDRRLRHARKAAQEAETTQALSRKAAHQFVNDVWRKPQQDNLPLSMNDTVWTTSSVTGRPMSMPKYITADLTQVEWGERNGELYWRLKGSRHWYLDTSTERDMSIGQVRGEFAALGGAFKPTPPPEDPRGEPA